MLSYRQNVPHGILRFELKRTFHLLLLSHPFLPPPLLPKQVISLSEELEIHTSSLAQTQEARRKAETELAELREDSHSQISHLVELVEQKSKAG